MATIGISEFTFGYAFLYEQTRANWMNLRAAPILPSLQQEQEEGWDAHLPLNGIDYYYQFKLSDYLTHGNAKFIADGTYNSPYYRLSLHRKDNNRQHQRLRSLAQTNPNTYYVAPEFNNLSHFHAAFLTQQITDNSRIIPVAQCKDISDSGQHYITFQPGQTRWGEYSEGKQHEESFFGKDLEEFYRKSSSRWRRIDKKFADELFVKTSALVKRMLEKEETRMRGAALRVLDFNPRNADKREVLMRISQILSVAFGATLVLVGQSDNP